MHTIPELPSNVKRAAMKQMGDHSGNFEAETDSDEDVAPDAERFVWEYAEVEEQDRYLGETDGVVI